MYLCLPSHPPTLPTPPCTAETKQVVLQNIGSDVTHPSPSSVWMSLRVSLTHATQLTPTHKAAAVAGPPQEMTHPLHSQLAQSVLYSCRQV